MTPAEADGVLFDGTTHCDEELPLEWSTAPGVRPELQADANTGVLKVLSLLEEHIPDHKDDAAPQRESELARIDAKLDLLLGVVGRLLAIHQAPPAAAAIHFSCRGLVWSGAPPAVREGARGRVLVHLHPAIPQPLEFAAAVLAVDDATAPRRAWIGFDPLPPGLSALLERHTFRRHRRAVAGLRQSRAA